jgi:pyruvate dehydrogenase E2 component (dihydrolipoamide acetyltransferase)
MNDIVMPKLSDTMTEGRVVSWKKQVGDAVRRGDVLAEVETDKANMELEAFTAGVLLEIKVPAGEMAQVGTVIAEIGTAEEKGAPTSQAKAAATEAAPQQAPAPPKAQAPQAAAAAAAAQATQGTQGTPAGGAAGERAAAVNGGKPEGGATEPVAPQGGPEAAGAQEAPGEAQAPAATALPTGAQVPSEAKVGAQAPAGAPTSAPGPAGAKEAPAGAPAAPVIVGRPNAGGPAPEAAAASPGAHGERAAPVVRRRARELGVDLGQVTGSGPEGRILLQDLERHPVAPGVPTESAASGGPAAPAAGVGEARAGGESFPLSRLRSAIAKTVAESWRSIPHFTVTADVAMDEAEAVRRQLKGGGVEVTLNDLIVKGVSLALGKFPRLNASLAGESLTLHNQVNIGVAVGVPDGVLIPVIPDCQRLSLLQIAATGRRLVDRARSGALSEQEMSGGTFSVSNLGMYGVSQFSAIIYPAQAAVLAVGAVSDTVVARGGVPVCARIMRLTLSADHRIVDGAYAAEFLAELKQILESPVRLLI